MGLDEAFDQGVITELPIPLPKIPIKPFEIPNLGHQGGTVSGSVLGGTLTLNGDGDIVRLRVEMAMFKLEF